MKRNIVHLRDVVYSYEENEAPAVNHVSLDVAEGEFLAVLGRNKVNIYFNDKVYQIKPEKRFNALRYVHFFNRYVNIKENNGNEFLGL
jgi:ABC-type microcin C transport system duplicated ATPase subunit YejF